MRKIILIIFLVLLTGSRLLPQSVLEKDTIFTSSGDLQITFIGHGTLMFEFQDRVIHLDPVSRYADYSQMPKADLVLITHHHGDHFDLHTVAQITKKETQIVCTETCSKELQNGLVMKNGDVKIVNNIKIDAVPAYNLIHKRENGQPYHPKGVGNGYVLTFRDTRVYVAGDTENFPEMKDLVDIDIAFLPMNLPYTMTPEMVTEAVHVINPKILYPYHFGNTNMNDLVELLKDKKDCEIRIRKLN